jgi:hypothetical protein
LDLNLVALRIVAKEGPDPHLGNRFGFGQVLDAYFLQALFKVAPFLIAKYLSHKLLRPIRLRILQDLTRLTHLDNPPLVHQPPWECSTVCGMVLQPAG